MEMIRYNVYKTLFAAQGELKLQLNLTIKKGQLVTLYGESGAGKTTTLRMLCGLLKPDGGEIRVNNESWFHSSENTNRSPQDRKVGYVFQDYALFPNMTVLQNLEFALGKHKDKSRIEELISTMELGDLKHRNPETLSGGQKQRVALARALVQQPDILLLDEPLSALDIKIRLKLQDYILKVHRKYNLTTILISHDIGEIHKLSDWVFVINNGQLVKQGSPTEVFVNQNISGKFKFTGEVLAIEKQDVVYIVRVLIHNDIVQIIAQENEIQGLNPGDRVVVASKAFNPVLYKIE